MQSAQNVQRHRQHMCNANDVTTDFFFHSLKICAQHVQISEKEKHLQIVQSHGQQVHTGNGVPEFYYGRQVQEIQFYQGHQVQEIQFFKATMECF